MTPVTNDFYIFMFIVLGVVVIADALISWWKHRKDKD